MTEMKRSRKDVNINIQEEVFAPISQGLWSCIDSPDPKRLGKKFDEDFSRTVRYQEEVVMARKPLRARPDLFVEIIEQVTMDQHALQGIEDLSEPVIIIAKRYSKITERDEIIKNLLSDLKCDIASEYEALSMLYPNFKTSELEKLKIKALVEEKAEKFKVSAKEPIEE